MRLVVDLIVSSPYLFDLDLPLFVRDFTVLGSAENASRCFYLFAKMPQTKKHEELIVFLIQNDTINELLNCIDFHDQKIRNMIFEQINKNKLYEKIMQSVHFDEFGKYLLQVDKIDGLLLFFLNQNLINEALNLISFYSSDLQNDNLNNTIHIPSRTEKINKLLEYARNHYNIQQYQEIRKLIQKL
ncbi:MITOCHONDRIAL 28S ribosomal protein S22 [Anaeramoeba ignava]|uniref:MITOCHONDRIAL 28S ribosomal protein S22 n=1 Tax=Anaeramoeba ignava TaxID=1746090 RepID=A0A9Q0LKW0_ANAIG|nr:MITOCHONDRIAL 28S ribosomal protein S22 [Anaeramoeba ignava]